MKNCLTYNHTDGVLPPKKIKKTIKQRLFNFLGSLKFEGAEDMSKIK
ncbi:hypothetical protein [Flagellimonas amphidinii]|nr:hypothetical protein [Allomuricauda amphidinii]